MTADLRRLAITIVSAISIAAAAACGSPTEQPADRPAASPAPPGAAAPAKKEFAFRGKVESVDAAARTFSVNGENVEGWMAPMTMVYKADKPEVFDKVKAGDQITAKVFEGDFATLYDVQIVGAAK